MIIFSIYSKFSFFLPTRKNISLDLISINLHCYTINYQIEHYYYKLISWRIYSKHRMHIKFVQIFTFCHNKSNHYTENGYLLEGFEYVNVNKFAMFFRFHFYTIPKYWKWIFKFDGSSYITFLLSFPKKAHFEVQWGFMTICPFGKY